MTNPSWKFLPVPTWNKTFSKATNDFNVMLDFIRVRVQDAIKQIEETGYSESDQDKSVLEKMITRNGKDSLIPLVTAIDLIAAGIDTMARRCKATHSCSMERFSAPNTVVPSSGVPAQPQPGDTEYEYARHTPQTILWA